MAVLANTKATAGTGNQEPILYGSKQEAESRRDQIPRANIFAHQSRFPAHLKGSLSNINLEPGAKGPQGVTPIGHGAQGVAQGSTNFEDVGKRKRKKKLESYHRSLINSTLSSGALIGRFGRFPCRPGSPRAASIFWSLVGPRNRGSGGSGLKGTGSCMRAAKAHYLLDWQMRRSRELYVHQISQSIPWREIYTRLNLFNAWCFFFSRPGPYTFSFSFLSFVPIKRKMRPEIFYFIFNSNPASLIISSEIRMIYM